MQKRCREFLARCYVQRATPFIPDFTVSAGGNVRISDINIIIAETRSKLSRATNIFPLVALYFTSRHRYLDNSLRNAHRFTRMGPISSVE